MSSKKRAGIIDDSLIATMEEPAAPSQTAPAKAKPKRMKKERTKLLQFRVTDDQWNAVNVERAKRGEKFIDLGDRIVQMYVDGEI